jgi:hypothetical protein
MKSVRRQLLMSLVEAVFLLGMHYALLVWLSNREVVAKVLAAGEHVPRLTLAAAVFFVVLRLVVMLLLPGVVLARLAMVAFQVWGPQPPVPVRSAPTDSLPASNSP